MQHVARFVDAEIGAAPAERRPACLYGVREDGAGFALDLLGTGDAHDLTRRIRPPSGLVAIAIAAGAWAAPMDEHGGCATRPSLHPERRHIQFIAVVGGHGEDASVIRYPGAEPLVASGGIGILHERLLKCWSRRRDAPKPTAPSRGPRSRARS